jgi:uncharacterized protein with PQ loop repeat
MTLTIEYLGFAGTTFCILAYLPQIIHLIKEKCSAGLSESAQLSWTIASILLLSYSICTRDTVFIVLQSYQLGSTVLIYFFCRKYKDSLCEEHGGESSELAFTHSATPHEVKCAPPVTETRALNNGPLPDAVK